MGYQLGIDLGTTYTAAAVCHSSDRHWVEPEVVTLGTRGATVASVLYIAPDGAVLVGEAAERRALTDPDRVVREFKRRVGDPTPIVVAGRAWAPEELSARLVRWVVDRVAEREGGPADRIAVTHPASWGAHKKDLLAGALAGQGLTVTFLAEPQAAALHYATAERIGAGATIAVYDLGGGTFDAAVVRKGDPGASESGPAGFGLLGRPEGLERLGGVDFDEVVFEHVRAGLPGAFENLDDTDPAVLSAVSRLRRDCTEAKEALSSDTEVSIPVLLPGSRGSVRLHRSEFEALIRPQVEETVEALRKAVASAGLAPEQLSAVLLVGGSSRIPLVAQLVSEQLGRPVAVDADPKNAIAKGAALALAPKPTVSWPGTAVPPVPAAVGGAGGGFVAAAALGAPPARPPRPSLPTPARGFDRAAAGPQAGAGWAAAPPHANAPRRPTGPAHEPATSLMSGGPARPPQSWQAEPAWEQEQPAWEPEPRRRPVGLLVGLGGLLVVGVILVALLVWPDSSPNFGVNTGNSGGDVTTADPTTELPVPTSPAPDPVVPDATDPGGGAVRPNTPKPGNSQPPAPVVPPAVPPPAPSSAPTTTPAPAPPKPEPKPDPDPPTSSSSAPPSSSSSPPVSMPTQSVDPPSPTAPVTPVADTSALVATAEAARPL